MRHAPALRSALLACGTLACASTVPVQPGDEELVVTLSSLQASTSLQATNPLGEKLTRTQGRGGEIEIEYEYAPTASSAPAPFVFSSYGFYPTPDIAETRFWAMNTGARMADGDIEVRDEFFRYGDHTRFGFIRNDAGVRVGTYYNMARGRSALIVMIGGLVIDDPDIWRDVISPPLRAIEAFEQRQPLEP